MTQSINAAVSHNQSLVIHPLGTATNSNSFSLQKTSDCARDAGALNNWWLYPPFDLVIARFECRTYRYQNGELKTPTCERAVHYHLKVTCVKAASYCFVPANLVSANILSSLSVTHNAFNVWFVFRVAYGAPITHYYHCFLLLELTAISYTYNLFLSLSWDSTPLFLVMCHHK